MLDRASPFGSCRTFSICELEARKVVEKSGRRGGTVTTLPPSFIETSKFPNLLRYSENESKIEIEKIPAAENRWAVGSSHREHQIRD